MRILSGMLLLMGIMITPVQGDTIALKDGAQLKGLIVEEHADRVILSTEKGETPVFREVIREIEYNDPAQNFFQVGKTYEDSGKYAEALAYYERALEINPNQQDARSGAVRARSRYWTRSMQGPQNEIDKQELLHGGWQKTSAAEEVKGVHSRLKQEYGLTLGRDGDWVVITAVSSGKAGAFAGLKSGDKLVMLEGQSLRYLSVDVTARKILSETARPFTLTVERNTAIRTGSQAALKDLGMDLHLEYRGLIISDVTPDGMTHAAGLVAGDLLTAVNGEKTRYMPIAKAKKLIETGSALGVKLSFQRQFIITSA